MAFNTPPIVSDDVLAIADLSATDLTTFINIGVDFTTEVLTGKGLSDATMRKIAIYLSAHFAFIKEGQVKSETIGPTSTTYNMTTGLGLKATTFGQQAIMFDLSGTLFALDNKKIKKVSSFEVF